MQVRDNSVFGNWVDHEWPPGTDIVIIGTCTGPDGIVPRALCLPHQVYVGKLQRLALQFNARDVALIPAKSADYLMLPRAEVDGLAAVTVAIDKPEGVE
jgi:hypothetical protein